jgi:hypothetical protein
LQISDAYAMILIIMSVSLPPEQFYLNGLGQLVGEMSPATFEADLVDNARMVFGVYSPLAVHAVAGEMFKAVDGTNRERVEKQQLFLGGAALTLAAFSQSSALPEHQDHTLKKMEETPLSSVIEDLVRSPGRRLTMADLDRALIEAHHRHGPQIQVATSVILPARLKKRSPHQLIQIARYINFGIGFTANQLNRGWDAMREERLDMACNEIMDSQANWESLLLEGPQE